MMSNLQSPTVGKEPTITEQVETCISEIEHLSSSLGHSLTTLVPPEPSDEAIERDGANHVQPRLFTLERLIKDSLERADRIRAILGPV